MSDKIVITRGQMESMSISRIYDLYTAILNDSYPNATSTETKNLMKSNMIEAILSNERKKEKKNVIY